MLSVIKSLYDISMILVDGRKIARKIVDELKKEVQKNKLTGTLAIIVVGGNEATKSFLGQKVKIGEELGFGTKIFEFSENINEEDFRAKVREICSNDDYQGVIIQLPLPVRFNTQVALDLVPSDKDVDVLGDRISQQRVSPIVCAVLSILHEYDIDFKGKTIAVIGKGRLVGQHLIKWFSDQSVKLITIDSQTQNPQEFSSQADIVISGIGKPCFIDAPWIKQGAVVIDAGTSESESPSTELGANKIVGDVDVDSIKNKASLVTPVPGGVGPITVACVWKNFVEILKKKKSV